MNLEITSTSDFGDFLTRLRLGDGDAIRAFVSKYEPFIRRALRFRIARASLQSAADSVDVCQSVLGGFLLRLAAGDYALASEDDLRRLLVAIANKKFLVLNRRETAAKRDHRNTFSLDNMKELADEVSQRGIGCVDHHDLLNEVIKRLSPDEQSLFLSRREGMSWHAIAERTSEDIIVLRKRLSRALNRVAVELKLEEDEI